jgi:mono/diheme cytochrome c family protein
LAGIAMRAAGRKPAMSAKRYLLESLLKPSAYLVKGYGALMPPMARILTPGEIMVTVAYLQSLGGEADITPAEVRQAMKAMAPATAQSAAPPPAGAAVAAGTVGAVKAGDPKRGGQVYMQHCAPCHGPDPAQDGPVGPRIKGAARALIEARLLRGGYPPGYRPKRATRLMPPLPQLEAELSHIAAFLGQ